MEFLKYRITNMKQEKITLSSINNKYYKAKTGHYSYLMRQITANYNFLNNSLKV